MYFQKPGVNLRFLRPAILQRSEALEKTVADLVRSEVCEGDGKDLRRVDTVQEHGEEPGGEDIGLA